MKKVITKKEDGGNGRLMLLPGMEDIPGRYNIIIPIILFFHLE
jgi:hypothetical protein